ncbi:MAG TPA: twitching motility protein, partial [Terriglobales bacterium]|nr:twitching motility protein [Terriglobales bacterium]
MATTPATAVPQQAAAAPKPSQPVISTPTLITTMVKFNARVSDLIISPFRPPQVELSGQLVAVPGLPVLSAQDTARIAADLIGNNKRAAEFLKNDGACDSSYSIPDLARFRINVFRQRGTYAIVMRTIPMSIPSFDDLKLPPQ